MYSFEDFFGSVLSTFERVWLGVAPRIASNREKMGSDLLQMDSLTLTATARKLGNDLMLCWEDSQAIQMLTEDQLKLAAFAYLTTQTSQEQRKAAVMNAYAKAPKTESILPFQSFCDFVLELCDLLDAAQPPQPNQGD